jgi:hypothetical protein
MTLLLRSGIELNTRPISPRSIVANQSPPRLSYTSRSGRSAYESLDAPQGAAFDSSTHAHHRLVDLVRSQRRVFAFSSITRARCVAY